MEEKTTLKDLVRFLWTEWTTEKGEKLTILAALKAVNIELQDISTDEVYEKLEALREAFDRLEGTIDAFETRKALVEQRVANTTTQANNQSTRNAKNMQAAQQLAAVIGGINE